MKLMQTAFYGLWRGAQQEQRDHRPLLCVHGSRGGGREQDYLVEMCVSLAFPVFKRASSSIVCWLRVVQSVLVCVNKGDARIYSHATFAAHPKFEIAAYRNKDDIKST